MDFPTIALIGLHLGSVHFPQDGYNNVNPGGYLVTPSGLTAGAFYNSQRHLSLYAGKNLPLYGPVSITLGAVTGYPMAPLLPLVAPSIKLGAFRLSTVPPIVGMPLTLHLSLEFAP